MQLSDYKEKIIVDSGPLFLHAASVFSTKSRRKIQLQKTVSSLKINETTAKHFSIILDRYFSDAREILVTPYVLAELCNLAEKRLKLKNKRLEDFVNSYEEFLLKLKECNIKKNELISFKRAWKLCFTDSSLALVSKHERTTIITIDKKLVQWCRSQGIAVKDAYYDIYLPHAFHAGTHVRF